MRDVCRVSLYHCFLAPREPCTMQTPQNIYAKLILNIHIQQTLKQGHAGRKQRTLRVSLPPDKDGLRCGGIYLGCSLEYNSEANTASLSTRQEAPNRIQRLLRGLRLAARPLPRPLLLCTYCDGSLRAIGTTAVSRERTGIHFPTLA